jgi:hypothetical protein
MIHPRGFANNPEGLSAILRDLDEQSPDRVWLIQAYDYYFDREGVVPARLSLDRKVVSQQRFDRVLDPLVASFEVVRVSLYARPDGALPGP